MTNQPSNNIKENKKETVSQVEDQAQKGDLKKGYNEQNPAQEGGAFEPDSKDDNTSNEPPTADDI